jgi:hypothetical protein
MIQQIQDKSFHAIIVLKVMRRCMDAFQTSSYLCIS